MAGAQTTPRNKRQEARERTKEELLQAGEQLLWEQFADGAADPLTLLSPKQITERASALRGEKLSHGMLYHHWPPPEPASGEAPPDKLAAYGRELLLRVLELPFDPEGVARAAMQALENGADLQELVRVIGKFEFDRYRYREGSADSKLIQVRFATLMLIFAETALWRAGKTEEDGAEDVSKLRNVMVSSMRERDAYAHLCRLYQLLLDRLGLEMADGFCVEDLVEGLWSMLDGFTINSWHFDRARKERTWRGQQGWSLFSIASFLFVDALTVPATGGHPPGSSADAAEPPDHAPEPRPDGSEPSR